MKRYPNECQTLAKIILNTPLNPENLVFPRRPLSVTDSPATRKMKHTCKKYTMLLSMHLKWFSWIQMGNANNSTGRGQQTWMKLVHLSPPPHPLYYYYYFIIVLFAQQPDRPKVTASNPARPFDSVPKKAFTLSFQWNLCTLGRNLWIINWRPFALARSSSVVSPFSGLHC